MAVANQVFSLADDVARYVEACGKRSILECKPMQGKIDIKSLHLKPEAIGDTVKFSFLNESYRSVLPKLKDSISSKNFLGVGGEGSVYVINDNFVLKMFHDATTDITKVKFSSVDDIFDGRNFGQVVAKAGDEFWILRRVKGVPLYKLNLNESDYLASFKKCCDFSDEVLESFVSDVAFLKNKGFQIDYRNGANFLFDDVSGKINFVDLTNVKNINRFDQEFSHLCILDSLIDSKKFYQNYCHLSVKERKELVESIEKLEQRLIPMCKKYNIPVVKHVKDSTLRNGSISSMLHQKENYGINYIDDMYEWANYINMYCF